MNIINNHIYIVRGDAGVVSLNLKDANGEPYNYAYSDTLTLTVKENASDETAKLTAVGNASNEYALKITSADTVKLAVGEYIYDIKIKKGEDVFTLIEAPEEGSNFTVRPSVG